VNPDPRTIAVVRRGDPETFDLLIRLCRGTDIPVHWDRRESERRSGSTTVPGERRRGDRRQPPPTTWRTMGFVIAASRTGGAGG
jgi:hypothetical protein